ATMSASGSFTINGAPVNINTSTGNTAIGNTTTSTTLAFNSGAGGSQTFTGANTTQSGSSSNFVFNGSALTSGNNLYLTSQTITTGNQLTIDSGTANTFTSGTLEKISSTSTAGTASGSDILLQLNRSGTNTNATHTAYGIQSTVSTTTNGAINYAGYFDAAGASATNYGIVIAGGNSGFGTTTPTEK